MWSRGSLRATRAQRSAPRACDLRSALAISLLALSVAGCATDSQPTGSIATPHGPTVAFESIDGPPEGTFRKLVQTLSEEADARQMAVVSRNEPAQFRVRGYVAAKVESGRTSIAWVWDVYDASQKRSLRLSGEEPAGRAGDNAWAAADDQVLHRIARAGMDQLTAFLRAPRSAPAGKDEAPAVAGLDGPGSGSGPVSGPVTSADVPAPRERPTAALAGTRTLAYAPGR